MWTLINLTCCVHLQFILLVISNNWWQIHEVVTIVFIWSIPLIDINTIWTLNIRSFLSVGDLCKIQLPCFILQTAMSSITPHHYEWPCLFEVSHLTEFVFTFKDFVSDGSSEIISLQVDREKRSWLCVKVSNTCALGCQLQIGGDI